MASGAIDVVARAGRCSSAAIIFLGLAAGDARGGARHRRHRAAASLVFLVLPDRRRDPDAAADRSASSPSGCASCATTAGRSPFRHAFVRALVGFVEIYLLLGVPAFFSSMVTPRGKRLGDYAAGTFVVTQRAALRLTPPPDAAGARAVGRSRRPGRLPSGLTLAVRQFLARAPGLTPQSRHPLGLELLRATLPHVSPAPTAGVPPRGGAGRRRRRTPTPRPRAALARGAAAGAGAAGRPPPATPR